MHGFLWSSDSVLEFVDDDFTTLEMLKTVHFKEVKFMVYKLHVNYVKVLAFLTLLLMAKDWQNVKYSEAI